jgi:hypothetical protein
MQVAIADACRIRASYPFRSDCETVQAVRAGMCNRVNVCLALAIHDDRSIIGTRLRTREYVHGMHGE